MLTSKYSRSLALFTSLFVLSCDDGKSPSPQDGTQSTAGLTSTAAHVGGVTSKVPSSGGQPNGTTSDAPHPECPGFPGHLALDKSKEFYSTLSPDVQNTFKQAIMNEDPEFKEVFGDMETYLGEHLMVTIEIRPATQGCPQGRTLWAPALRYTESKSEQEDVLTFSPCLGLSKNPDPALFYCTTLEEVDAFNSSDCVDPAFKGLACAPKNLDGLSIPVDKNPCFVHAKADKQAIHARTMEIMKSANLGSELKTRAYNNIQKCLGEKGATWLIGPVKTISHKGEIIECHGFSNEPSVPALECYRVPDSAEPKVNEACGKRWVCLSRE